MSEAQDFPGGGMMGDEVRAHDWAATPLGPADAWPQSLRTALSIMLNSAFPSYLAWGPELTSFYNDAYIPIMGDKPNGLGRPFPDVWSEVWDTIGPITRRAMRGEASYFEDLPLTLMRSGYPEPTWFSFSYSPIRDETGGVGGVLCTVYETTRRIQAEAALRRSEARLQAAVDLVAVIPYSWNPASDVLDWDVQLKSMWGVSSGRVMTFDMWISAIHPDDRPRVERALARCLDPAGDGVYHAEYRVIGIEDGIERWVSTHGQTTFEEGRPIALTGAALDTTCRKQAETALRQSEIRLGAILDQLPLGVGLADSTGHITLRNRLLQQYLPETTSSDDLKQAQPRSGLAERRTSKEMGFPIARALRGETVVSGVDVILPMPDGRDMWTRMSAVPLREAGDDDPCAVFVLQDIDREKRAEQRFREFSAHSTNVFWIANMASRTLEYLNPAFERMFGAEPGCAQQDMSRWMSVVHPEDRARVVRAFEKAGSGAVSVEEFRIFRSDGAVRWISNTFFPMRDEEGHIGRTGGIAQDITRHEGRFVYVVDENVGAGQDLADVLRQAGYDVRTFTSGRGFLEAAPALRPGCAVMDLRKPGADDLMMIPRELKARRIDLPVIALGDAGGDLMFGVNVMKAGAVDFLSAPCRPDKLRATVASALADILRTEDGDQAVASARARLAEMPLREREVLTGILAGQTNKQIGRSLGISPRTVETHRAHVMQRLGAKNVPEAVRAAALAGFPGPAGR